MTFQELSFHPNIVKPNRTMRRRLVLPAPHAIAFAHVIRLDYCTARNHVSSFLRRALRHLTASSRAFVHAPRTPPHPILNQLSSGIMTVSPAPPFAKVRASYCNPALRHGSWYCASTPVASAIHQGLLYGCPSDCFGSDENI